MKVLHTADWHLGQFKGPVENGVNLRSLDTEKCLDYMVEVAREEKPDLVCISGDIFHQELIGPARYTHEVLEAAKICKELADVAKYVVVMRGTPNHDGGGQFCMLKELLSPRKNVEVVVTPQVIMTPFAAIACIPGFDKQEFRAKFPGLPADQENLVWTEQISNIVMGLRANCAVEPVPAILMAHYTVPGCNMESGQTSYAVNFEPVIPREALQAANFDGVFLGHIHRPQMLEGFDNVFYSGAINALNFNDEGQSRGFWMHEFEGTRLVKGHRYDTPYRHFYTIHWEKEDVTEYLAGGKMYLSGTGLGEKIKDCIVRLYYSCDTNQRKALNIPQIKEDLYDLGAFLVYDVEAESMIDVANRGLMKEESDPLVNLRKWLDEKCFKDADRIVELAEPIIAAAQKENVTADIHGVFRPVSISVKNYRNYKEERFDFSDVSFCTINGANGAGKSSLFMDAIADCLFEKTREGDKTSWIRATEDAKSGMIEFIFDIGEHRYRVVRTRVKSGRTTLNLSQQDGEEWVNLSKERSLDTQAEIEKVIGMDSLTFRSCALIMQDQYGLFLQAGKNERISILGNLLGLGIYEGMEKDAIGRLREANRELAIAKNTAALKQKLIDEKGDPEKELADVAAALDVLTQELGTLNLEAQVLQSGVDSYENVKARQTEKQRHIGELTRKKDAILTGIETQRRIEDECILMTADAGLIHAKADEYRAAEAMARSLLPEKMRFEQAQKEQREAEAEAERYTAEIDRSRMRTSHIRQQIDALRASLTGEDIASGLELLSKARTDLDEMRRRKVEDMRIRQELTERSSKRLRETARIESEIAVLRQRLSGYQTSEQLIRNSGCIDMEHAACRFLAKAKEDVTCISETNMHVKQLEETLIRIRNEEDADQEETKKALSANGYEAASEALLEAKVRDYFRYEDLAKQEADTKTEIGRLEASAASADEITARYAEMLSTVKLKAQRAHETVEELTDTVSRYEESLTIIASCRKYVDRETQLPVYEERIKNARERAGELKKDLEDMETQIAVSISELDKIQTELSQFDSSAILKLQEKKLQIQDVTGRIERLNITKGTLLQKAEDVKQLMTDIDRLKAEIDEGATKVARYEALKVAFSQDGVPHQIIRNIIPHITDTANNILGSMTGGTMGVEFVMEKTDKGKEGEKTALDVLINEYGKTTLPYASKSGGEKVKASLAVILALAEIKTGAAGIQLGMLFIDEPPFLDDEGTQAYVDALETIRNRYPDVKVMAITHDDAMKARFIQAVTVIKTEEGSRVIY